jgi:hexosaminidase
VNRLNLIPVPRTVDLAGEVAPAGPVVRRIDRSLPAQGYSLRIAPDGVELAGADDAGLFYGEATLAQLARLHDGGLPAGTVVDHPDLPVRGVMLDISRDKVPSLDTLCALIDRMASLKVNQVQLYSEHTFAYRDHRDVNASASPLDADDIRTLDAFCAARHVELVPNQNCLGHMNRWLAHRRYRTLAIAPDGFVDPYGIARKAMTIEPTNPGSLALVRELLAELLPLFTSRRVHVGLDEAWELPQARLGDFLDWVATLRGLPELAGHEMLMWGDMLAGRADLLGTLPEGVTICEWGYDDWYPFDERGADLATAGVPFWVAPGTSSWLSILGRLTNARTTCRRAAEAAVAHGGVGYLNTDWGDNGHLQQAVVSEPALVYGAAVSWCLDANADVDLAAALSTHVFGDPTGELAAAVLALGDLHRLITPQFPNMSALVTNLYYPQLPVGRGLTEGLTVGELDAVDAGLDQARRAATQSRPGRADGPLLVDETVFGADLVALLVHDARARLANDGTIASVPATARKELASVLDELIDRYRARWLARNRPGGLEDSLGWLLNLRNAYVTGHPDKTWGGLPVARDGS